MVHIVIHDRGDDGIHPFLLVGEAEVAMRPPNGRCFLPALLLEPSTCLLHGNVSIPDADLARHPACLTNSAEEGHQGVVDYRPLRSSDCGNVKIGKAKLFTRNCAAAEVSGLLNFRVRPKFPGEKKNLCH